MAGVLAVAITALVVTAYAVTERTLAVSLDQALSREANAYAAAVASAPSDQALVEATRTYLRGRSSTGSGLDPILVVVLEGGHTISNSDVRLENASGVSTTTAGRTSARYSLVTLESERYRLLSVPVTSGGRKVGTFRVALSARNAGLVARSVAGTLASAGLIALALGLPLSYLATRRALSPLAQMAEDAARITKTTDRHAIAYDGPTDELGTLATALNDMLTRLDESASAQRAFIADASHELRTPVAVVRGNVDLLRSGALGDEDAEDALRMIGAEAERMARLLDELLALARLEATGTRRFQPLSVPVLLDEAAMRGRRMGGCDFTVSCERDAWVSGDPDLLDQALGNLVRNAAIYTPHDGCAVLSCESDGARALISVTDDGPGIPEAELPRLFDRFYRQTEIGRDDASGGAGLGLAIVKRVVELHGGTVAAANVKPHGARFTIALPLTERPKEQESVSSA